MRTAALFVGELLALVVILLAWGFNAWAIAVLVGR